MLALDQIKNSKKKGFTLIELVIVLAIAALIMVIVFLAVAGAQRSQRDNTSSDAAGKVIAAYASYLGDNNNTAPTADTQMKNYLGTTKDGRGNEAKLSTDGEEADGDTEFLYLANGECNGSKLATAGSSTSGTKVAVVYYSEQKKASVCKSN